VRFAQAVMNAAAANNAAAVPEMAAGNGTESGADSPPGDLEQRFEEEFSQYVKDRTWTQQWQYTAAGAAIGGALGLALAPVVLPGMAVAGVAAGASGYGLARHKGQHELPGGLYASDGNGTASPSIAPVPESQRPTRRRLKYLVKWGVKQLLECARSSEERRALVLDEVVRSFSPWVQQLFLLQRCGRATESDAEAWNVFLHLMPLYYFLQQEVPAQASIQAAELTGRAMTGSPPTLDVANHHRCQVVFPIILEVISTVDRLSPATEADIMRRVFGRWEDVSLAPRAERREHLQQIVTAIRGVLERADVRRAMSQSPSGSQKQASFGFRRTDAGAHDDDEEYYSFSEDEEEKHPSPARSSASRSQLRPAQPQAQQRRQLPQASQQSQARSPASGGVSSSPSSMSASKTAMQKETCGCGHKLDTAKMNLRKDDPIQEHYKKTGLWGGFTGLFGDKKTMYCHHVTSKGEFAVRAAGSRKFSSEEEVWTFLGKRCCGRYCFDSKTRMLVCGSLVEADHDDTCVPETCLFRKNGLRCPTPAWALKKV